jgi:PAS domain S-box-containing protein
MAFDKGVLEQRNLRFILQPEQKVNILLVDDQPKNLLALDAILDSRLGQNLVKANSGEQALKCVLNQDFAVILLDVQMPGMDGLETAKLIRERERSRQTPIIFLTAFSTSASQMFKGYSLGAVDYLLKPIEPEILTSKVAVFVELFKKTAQVKQQAAQLATVNAELRENEERFRCLSACSPVGIFLTDIEGRCTYTNSRYQAICGLTQEESLEASWLQLVHPEDREQVLADWSAWALKGQEYSNELRLVTQEGNVRWVHVRSSPMLSDKGELIGYVGTLENITSRKQASLALCRANEALECRVQERTAKLRDTNEQLSREIAERKGTEAELEKSLSLLHATLQSTASGIVAVNLERDIVTFNQKFVDMWQVPDAIMTMTLQDYDQHLDFFRNQLKNPETFDSSIREVYSQPDIESYEILELKDGRLFERYSKPQRLGEKIIGLVWSFREITERKRTEEALRQSEARFRTLAETTDAIIFIQQGSQFCYVNPAAEAITGYRREELLAYPDICELIKERGQLYQQGISVFPRYEEIKHREEIKILTKNGEERWLDCCVGVIEFEGKLAVLGTAIDLTRHKQAEVEISQAFEQEKELSELRARFISLVSHEFRTPLNNISLSTSSLRRYSHQWSESEKHEYLCGIETDIEQLSSLLDEALIIGGAEAAKQKFEPRPLDVAQFCRDLVAEMELSDSGQHAFSFISRGNCRVACVDKKLLQPILTNLLSNAIKYSPTNSKVDLELSCGDGEVIFQIKDRGIGIAAADQQQLSEPFHRGRNVGDIQGTGLGLSVVKKFVDLHGGQISVASEVGVGTTFTFTLPLVDKLLEREETIPLIVSVDQQLNSRRHNEKDSSD